MGDIADEMWAHAEMSGCMDYPYRKVRVRPPSAGERYKKLNNRLNRLNMLLKERQRDEAL